jgi:hypothetical protein
MPSLKPPAKSFRPTVMRTLAMVMIAALAIVIVALSLRRPAPRPNPVPAALVQTSLSTTNPSIQGVASNASGRSAIAAGAGTAGSNFLVRPFAVAKESPMHQWTIEDGRDTNVIRQLAHNDAEYRRMVEENSRIQRRQLVYRKDTAAAMMQRARLSGEPVKQLTLPGFDGRELQVEIDRADLESSWQSGTFAGRLEGRPNSMVTLAFKFGREAFTIVSPDDGTYLQAHPREPGELIITSFDPDTYQPMPGGEPIRTTQ